MSGTQESSFQFVYIQMRVGNLGRCFLADREGNKEGVGLSLEE